MELQMLENIKKLSLSMKDQNSVLESIRSMVLRAADVLYGTEKSADDFTWARNQAIEAGILANSWLASFGTSPEGKPVRDMLALATYYNQELNGKLRNAAANMLRTAKPDQGVTPVLDSKTPDSAKEIMEAKAIIEAAIVKTPCGGFRGFDRYAGGEVYEKLFYTIIKAPFQFKQFKSSGERILLAGPPGTGKSRIGEAVAASFSDATFINIVASDLLDKYVAGGEIRIKMLFEVARAHTYANGKKGKRPVVIFIDELDGAISKDNKNAVGMIAELNAQTEGSLKATNDGVIVLTATNYPARIPANVMSRFATKIYMGLPTASTIRETMYHHFMQVGAMHLNLDGWSMPPGDIPLKTFLGKNNDQNDVSVKVAQKLYSICFSMRDIVSMLRLIDRRALTKSIDFAALKHPVSDGYTHQRWLFDRSVVKKTVTDKSGKCTSQSIVRKALIPISTLDLDGTWLEIGKAESAAGPKYTINSDHIMYVETVKKFDNDTNKPLLNFTKRFDPRTNSWVEWTNAPTLDLGPLLSRSQIDEKDLTQVFTSHQPSTIDDIESLIQFVENESQHIQGEEDPSTIVNRLRHLQSRTLQGNASEFHSQAVNFA